MTLTGAAEVPGRGDLDGSGTVVLKVRPDRDQVCFDIHVAARARSPGDGGAHPSGTVGVAGAIVVTLGTPDATGKASGCVSASHDLLKAIKQNPSEYYVNVHTTDLPNGALRGQLATSSGQGQGQGSDKFQTSLKGKNEVPGPGDTDGSGSADITVDRTLNQVCFTIHVSGVTLPATAAHIHQGATGIAGPIVVTSTPPDANGSSSGCAVVMPDLVNAIIANPSEYYVNVHTTDPKRRPTRPALRQRGMAAEATAMREAAGTAEATAMREAAGTAEATAAAPPDDSQPTCSPSPSPPPSPPPFPPPPSSPSPPPFPPPPSSPSPPQPFPVPESWPRRAPFGKSVVWTFT